MHLASFGRFPLWALSPTLLDYVICLILHISVFPPSSSSASFNNLTPFAFSYTGILALSLYSPPDCDFIFGTMKLTQQSLMSIHLLCHI